MKASLYFLGIVVASLVGSAAFGHPSSLQFPGNSERVRKAKELGVIQGRVSAKDDEYPLAQATLALRSTGAAPLERSRTVRTDGSGEYTFRDLEPGRYVLRAARKGYIPKNYGQKSSYSLRREEHGTILTVDPGQVLEDIDFHLTRGGVVEGRVVDQNNEPVETGPWGILGVRPGRSPGRQ